MSKPLQFLTMFASAFTKPAAALFLRIAEGWALCPSRRTLTNVYRFGDPHHTNNVEATHYFFRDLISHARSMASKNPRMSASSTQFTFLFNCPAYSASKASCWPRPGRNP